MELYYVEELKSALISVAIALIATYAVSLAYPTEELRWTLTAVGFASFFSGFFSNYFAGK